MSATPGFRSIMLPTGWGASSDKSLSFRRMRGFVRNGQVLAEYSAHSLCEGGSAETPFTAHKGPVVNDLNRPNGWPQTQQIDRRTASSSLPGATHLKSGSPAIHATNHGTG